MCNDTLSIIGISAIVILGMALLYFSIRLAHSIFEYVSYLRPFVTGEKYIVTTTGSTIIGISEELSRLNSKVSKLELRGKK